MVLFLSSGSPLLARTTFPIIPFLLAVIAVAIVLILAFIAFKKYEDYKKSDAYLEKEKNRITNKKDIKNLSKYYHFTPKQEKLLWEICTITQCHNFAYLLKDINQIYDLFKEAYAVLKDDASEEKITNFFNLLYKIENIAGVDNELKSTEYLKPGFVVFYMNANGEKFPFYVIQNTSEYFSLEIPEFLYNSEKRPKIMERLRFIYKDNQGTSYNFISRISRYEKNNQNQCLINVVHTDKITSTIQRHYRRQYIDKGVYFSAVKINSDNSKKDDIYVYSDKKYPAELSNISAGGCCIETPMPIKELQHLCLDFSELSIDEKVVGIIKHTRKLPQGGYALHIQFVKISGESKNKVFLLIYGYEKPETLAN